MTVKIKVESSKFKAQRSKFIFGQSLLVKGVKRAEKVRMLLKYEPSPQSFTKSTVKGLGEWSKPKGWPRGW